MSVVDTGLGQTLKEWENLLVHKRCDILSARFMRMLKEFDENPFPMPMSPEQIVYINEIVRRFLDVFCSPYFELPSAAVLGFTELQCAIANLIALTVYKSSDKWLARLDPAVDLQKYLILYNIRAKRELPSARIFDLDVQKASLWWTCYWAGGYCMASQPAYESIYAHASEFDGRLTTTLHGGLLTTNYLVSYLDPVLEKPIKHRINTLWAKAVENIRIHHSPNPRSIAIISAYWFSGHAVYKSICPLVKSLHGHYRLTLIQLGDDNKQPVPDMELFERIIRIRLKESVPDINEIQNNDFGMAVFLDVGLNAESALLSNVRIAPIQVSCYGHPVSTHSPVMDYFIGGADVEDLERAASNYSERLVCIPGIGAHPAKSNYTPSDEYTGDGDQIIINCSWSPQKINYPLVRAVQKIKEQCGRPVNFHFFIMVAPVYMGNYVQTLVRDLYNVLGSERILVFIQQPYDNYMSAMEIGTFSLDAYPFGGYNTVMDSLFLGKPIITRKGNKAANRLASAVLEQLDLHELVAHSEEEYIEKAVRLIRDNRYRNELTIRIKEMKLEEQMEKSDHPDAFCRAIDFLMANHDFLQQNVARSPIIID